MSKRYPPIFNVILFIVAVCVIIVNPMTMLMPWISTVTSFVVFAVSSIFNAVGYVYDHYTIFALHVVIIALYAKQLFGKEAKAKYHEAIELAGTYKQSNDEEEYREVHCKLVDALAPLYIESTLVLIVVTLNIIFPNFYQFTLLQINWFGRVDVTTDYVIIDGIKEKNSQAYVRGYFIKANSSEPQAEEFNKVKTEFAKRLYCGKAWTLDALDFANAYYHKLP